MSKQHSKIRIVISYGYDIHSLELLASDFERIKKGESLAIIGQGFSIEGEMTQDTWLFKNKTISVDCENGFDIFKGNLDNILSIEDI
jgi:ABC-type Zn uptake system ZnuABC Zn-binding protein ZnuA